MELGRVGVWTSRLGQIPDAEARRAVAEIEDLGFGAIWYPEIMAKEAMSQAALLLAAGERITVATGIANIWARDPAAMINGARTLVEAFPDRFLLGIGVSHAPTVARRGHQYRSPLATMAAYLDAMDAAGYMGPRPAAEPPVVLAALGPRMLHLAAGRTRGAHPYFVPVEHTVFARKELGEAALLAPEQAVVLSTDSDEARQIARAHTRHYLALDNYRNNLTRLGWSEADLADAGSDALVDAIVAWGDVEAIRSRVAAHLAAGANHVGVQVLDKGLDHFPMDDLRRMAPALLEL
jgi:probable F420-dependent oxidoreductase